MSGERERDLQAQVEALTKERDEALTSIRKVQNAAKTIASAHGSELEHLRQNATYDYRLRAEHESLQERDAQMTEALLTAEGECAALRALLREAGEALRCLASEVGGMEIFEPDVREAISNTNWCALMHQRAKAIAVLAKMDALG